MTGGGQITLNPDEEVQARLRLVFAKFRELQSARAVMLYLRRNALRLPVRPLFGPSPHELVWREASASQVRYILHNPAYAGAYVYGRRTVQAAARATEARPTSVKVPLGQWKVCLLSAHPGYIGWEEFMTNQKRLSDNPNDSKVGRRGVPRRGVSLLQGVAPVVLRPMRSPDVRLRYSGPYNSTIRCIVVALLTKTKPRRHFPPGSQGDGGGRFGRPDSLPLRRFAPDQIQDRRRRRGSG